MNGRGHVSALDLDRWLLQSLSASERQTIDAHLESCEGCRRSLDELQADRRRFEREVLPRSLPAVRLRLGARGRRRSWGVWIAAPALAAAAAIALWIGAPAEPELGVKGGPAVQVFAQRGGRIFAATERTILASGDRLRFVVQAVRPGYLLIAGVDGSGQIALYHPAQGTESARVDAGRTEIQGAIELDASPGPERFYAFFSDAPLAYGAVHDALVRDPNRPAVAGVGEVVALVFNKR